jgi:glycosyltransferase involved in cell wall biosynthesis
MRNCLGKIIYAFIERFPDGSPTPCAYIRIINKYSSDPLLDFRLIQIQEQIGQITDRTEVVVHRSAISCPLEAKRLISFCEKQQIGLIYDLDDDLPALAKTGKHPHLTFAQPAIELFIKEAKLMTVSTPVLLNRYRGAAKEIILIDNTLSRKHWGLIEPNKTTIRSPFRILYMGTSTHEEDYLLIVDALESIHREFNQEISINFMGVTNSKLPNWINRINLGNNSHNYPAFVNTLRASHTRLYQIGLAPLVDNYFNKAKSDLKFLDYTALGCTTIASNIDCYNKTITNGGNGFLAEANHESWYRAIKCILTDAKTADLLYVNAFEALKKRIT